MACMSQRSRCYQKPYASQGIRSSSFCVCCSCLVAKLCLTLLLPLGLQPSRFLCPWDFAGKNTAVACHFLLRGIFPTQGSNMRLPHWQADSFPLSHQGAPFICEFLNLSLFCFFSLKPLKVILYLIPININVSPSLLLISFKNEVAFLFRFNHKNLYSFPNLVSVGTFLS